LTNINILIYPHDLDTTQTSASEPRESETARCAGKADPSALTLAPAQTGALEERLKALADPTRLRMVDLLAQQSAPLCVRNQ
jgi:hypothetical protein